MKSNWKGGQEIISRTYNPILSNEWKWIKQKKKKQQLALGIGYNHPAARKEWGNWNNMRVVVV